METTAVELPNSPMFFVPVTWNTERKYAAVENQTGNHSAHCSVTTWAPM